MKYTEDVLDKYFHILVQPEEKKKKEEPPFIIPTAAVKDIMMDPFNVDESQEPYDHLYNLEPRCSLFKLSGISHDNVEKLFYVFLKGDAQQWSHSLNHSDWISWEDLKKAFHIKYYSPYKA
jgi:hypothetical protein